jgi:hypothetical protein
MLAGRSARALHLMSHPRCCSWCLTCCCSWHGPSMPCFHCRTAPPASSCTAAGSVFMYPLIGSRRQARLTPRADRSDQLTGFAAHHPLESSFGIGSSALLEVGVFAPAKSSHQLLSLTT